MTGGLPVTEVAGAGLERNSMLSWTELVWLSSMVAVRGSPFLVARRERERDLRDLSSWSFRRELACGEEEEERERVRHNIWKSICVYVKGLCLALSLLQLCCI